MKSGFFPKSLRIRILCILFIGIIVTVSVSFFVQLENSKKRVQEDEIKSTTLLSSVLYSILEQTMAKGRVNEVSRALDGIAKNPLFTRIEILDRNMNPRFWATGLGKMEKERSLTIPVRSRQLCKKCHGNADPIGYLRIGFDTSIYDERFVKETMLNLGTSLAVLITLSIMVYICLEKGLFSRLQKINIAMQYFGRGNLKYRIKVDGEDELSKMAKAFNDMARNIYKINYRLFKVSEFSNTLSRCRSVEETLRQTVGFLIKYFDINGAKIMVRMDSKENEFSDGVMKGIIYSEAIFCNDEEIGYIKVSASKDMTVEELSALKIVASSVSTTLERLTKIDLEFEKKEHRIR